LIGRINGVDQRLDQLKVDQSEAVALLKNVNGQLASMRSTEDSAVQVQENPVTAGLKSKLADVETQLADAEQKYTPAHPLVISLRAQRSELQAQIAAQPSSIVGQTTVAPNPLYQTLQQQASTYTARIDGDEVYLCWKLGEDRIRFYHRQDEGFAGRKPIDPRDAGYSNPVQ